MITPTLIPCRLNICYDNQTDFCITRHLQHQNQYKRRTRDARINNADNVYGLQTKFSLYLARPMQNITASPLSSPT